MAPNKKAKPQPAYFYFMLEYKRKHNMRDANLTAVAQAADTTWRRMSKEERAPYEAMSAQDKSKNKATKFTTTGIEIAQLEKEDEQRQSNVQEMKEEINNTLRMASNSGNIADQKFLVIHFNVFCFCSSLDRYFPAEVAVIEFSLRDGVYLNNVFHRRIQPGQLPLGYAAAALLHSKETHGLNVPMMGDTENNMEEVFKDLSAFLKTKTVGSSPLPILYAVENDQRMVQHILDTWILDYAESNSSSNSFYSVYNLQYMFRILKNTVAGEVVWASDTFSHSQIEKDVYSYTSDICCDYHTVTNSPVFCSKSKVIRFAFVICDNCTPYLDIELIPGNHVPYSAQNMSSRTSSSVASSAVSDSWRVKSSKSSCYSASTAGSTFGDDDNMSVMSDSTVCDSDYPDLGYKKAHQNVPLWNPYAHPDTSSGAKSYAGATGRRLPSLPSTIVKYPTDSEASGSEQGLMDDNAFPQLGGPSRNLRGAMGGRSRDPRRRF